MAYLGRNPAIGTQKVLDSLESQFNGALTTFNLRYTSNVVYPTLSSSLIVSLGGVLQEPGTAYTVASDQIIFASAPATGTDCWILLYSEFGAQAGATPSLTVANNATIGGELHGPANFVIDPAVIGNNTGTVEIKGNLTVQGTTTTINSTVVDLDTLSLGDNEKISLGAGGVGDNGGAVESDLEIYSDGTNAYFDSGFIASSASPNIYFRTSSSTTLDTNALTILNSGNVGIGTNSPLFKLDIVNGTANTGANANNPDVLSVTGTNRVLTAGGANLFINSNSAMAADTGGQIALSGRHVSSSTNSMVHATIKGAKETAVSTNANSYLAFGVSNHNIGGLVERLRIDSSGRLLLGTTTEGEATADNLTIQDSGHCGITLRSGDDDVGTVFFSDGTSGTAEYEGYIQYDHEGNFLKFAANHVERLRITSGGALNIGTGTESNNTANLVEMYVGATDETYGTIRGKYNRGNEYNRSEVRFGVESNANGFGFLAFATGNNSATERLRITSGGDVGIGNNGSFGIYTGANDRNLILGTGSGNSAIQIHSSSSGYGGIYFGDITSGSGRYTAYVEFKHGTNDDFLRFGTASNERLRIDSSGHVTPAADDTQDLGSASKRWRNIYTGDLQLSNEGSSNEVDGTWGNYTIQEGEEELFIINRRSGKKFKFVLEEVK